LLYLAIIAIKRYWQSGSPAPEWVQHGKFHPADPRYYVDATILHEGA